MIKAWILFIKYFTEANLQSNESQEADCQAKATPPSGYSPVQIFLTSYISKEISGRSYGKAHLACGKSHELQTQLGQDQSPILPWRDDFLRYLLICFSLVWLQRGNALLYGLANDLSTLCELAYQSDWSWPRQFLPLKSIPISLALQFQVL